MHKGNQAPLAFASATTSSLPTASQDICSMDNFALFSFGRKQIWESEPKPFPAQLSRLCPCLPQGRSRSTAYRKPMQGISSHQNPFLVGTYICTSSAEGWVWEQCWTQGPEEKCGKWRAPSWCGRAGGRDGGLEGGLISHIKIRFKMKPALGNLSALSKRIMENKWFLMKFFCKQRCSQRASSTCSSLVRTEGWGRMCKMDGIYCIYIQKPESEIDLISYLDRVIRQIYFFFKQLLSE